MQQFRIMRTLASLPFVAGGFSTYDLPRGYDAESIYMRLNGTVQVTGAATSVRAESPCGLIQRVEVVADGRNTLFSAPFWYCVFGAYDRAAQLENGARYTTPPTGTGVATYTVEANGNVDFLTVDGERPKDSNLRTSGFQLFQLKITWGNASDAFVGGTVPNANANMAVELSTSEMVELPDAAGKITTPVTLAKVSYQEIALPASNVNQELRLPAGNLIKHVIIRTEGLTVAGEPQTGVLNNVQAFSGTDVRLNMSVGALRAKNNNDFGYVLPGYHVLDFSRSGAPTARLTELWDVTRQAEPKVSLNVTGAANAKAQVVIREYLGLMA